MDWRLAMARLQLQLEGLSQAGWRYDSRPPGPASTSLVSASYITFTKVKVKLGYIIVRSKAYLRA